MSLILPKRQFVILAIDAHPPAQNPPAQAPGKEAPAPAKEAPAPAKEAPAAAKKDNALQSLPIRAYLD